MLTTTLQGMRPGNRSNSKFAMNTNVIYRPSVCDRTVDSRLAHLKRSNEKKIDRLRQKSTTTECLTSAKPGRSKIMMKREYEHLKERGRVVTKEDRQRATEVAEKEKERLMKESMERKEAIRRMDIRRKREKDPKTTEIEEAARRKMMYILERAHNMRLEQEEEIQKCNQLIMATKCRAIRDAQIAEKKLIERESLEEEKRLNNMMENERRWAIKEELRKEQESAAKRMQFANILKKQISENQEQRILQFERKQEESRLINLSNIAREQDEIEKMREKRTEDAKIRQEQTEEQEQLKFFKAMEQEEERIIDLRIQDYHRIKEEKEVKKAEEEKLEKLRKEQERDRIAAHRMQTQQLQTQIEESNATRVQEEVEREWRQREKEEVLKKLEAQRTLWKEREEQINTKRIMQAIEIERERREFEKIVREQEAAFDKEKKELEQKQQKALIHRSEILEQVNAKERERITERQKMFEETSAISAEITARKKKLQDAMKQKCRKMKEDNVSDIYINEVKRMIENIR